MLNTANTKLVTKAQHSAKLDTGFMQPRFAPKPRAEGSSPSAPAKKAKAFADFSVNAFCFYRKFQKKDLNPKWACTVKKNSPGGLFLGARCEDGYQNPQDFGRQAVQIRQKADLRPSAPATHRSTSHDVLLLFCTQKPL